MQVSERWLREWANPPVTAAKLAHKLNLAGLECEAAPMLAEPARGVVVGRILTAERHPQADRLQVCTVDVGDGTPRQIVCGAPNARAGLCAPCALPGAKLPGGMEIKDAKLRGVDSSGMLCSAKELALSDKSEGLLELDDSAVPGTAIDRHLQLDDNLLSLELTPNRGDCLSIAGLARETAALYGLSLDRAAPAPVVIGLADTVEVSLGNPADCTAFAGRVIRGLSPVARTPDWMREKLRRSGIRVIHPLVDITNYVLIELGQPMHAYDLAKLPGAMAVRRARAGETLKLLNDDTVTLGDELLVVSADQPVGLAGVMGGAASMVGEGTTAIFFEAAAFTPAAVAGVARRHKLSSDAAYRFERGVDPALQRAALERATALALEICGGAAGPICFAGIERPAHAPIRLRHQRLLDLLGCAIAADAVEALLRRLGVAVQMVGSGEWQCTPPSWRFDLAIEQDLIEEIARLHGYENIPVAPYAAVLVSAPASEARRPAARVKDALVARGWQEAVTYSFVDPKLQARLTPDFTGIPLDNPIAETMAVMRTTLWSGLIGAWLHNHQRQHKRARFFELAACFAESDAGIVETPRLAGLAAGPALDEQWASPARAVDFYDVKADLEAVCAVFGGDASRFRFEPGSHPALHPGRCARLLRDGIALGWYGELHPVLARELDLPAAPLLFEFDWSKLSPAVIPQARPVSEFPASRRDLAVVVDEAVSAQALLDRARKAAGPSLSAIRVFDVYRGQGLRDGSKSVALGLIFQDYSRTLTLEDIDAAMAQVTASLALDLGAVLRE
ncbi:MAG: phenylalanine--tRNA ligase subunit beta [Stagnimonas sp.]|nr:phenylalanine--tRNA ligase subunit beta [Stagnimonas sp.]